MSLKAFLLCAGQGSRFHPHTNTLPKVLLPFLNLPLISYNLYLLKKLKVTNLAANVHTQANKLEENITKHSKVINIPKPVLSFETKLLGAAGGLLKLKPFFENTKNFFYLNGDSLLCWNPNDNFYNSHVKSGAMASFLCKPTHKKTGVIWADKNYQVLSFLKKPNTHPTKAYDFCGLALFSKKIFKEIKLEDHHIFKDVLESQKLKPHLRIHCTPDLEFLDMNQLKSYLQNTKKTLYALKNNNTKVNFLKKTLDVFSPKWRAFEGENYFSATPIKNPFPIKNQLNNKKDFLFCGKEVKGLSNLSIKNFAVIGNKAVISSKLHLEESVLGDNYSSKNKTLYRKLILK